MSADSPKRTVRCVPAIVPPQAVSDRSIIDSVAGFINDVTLTNQPQGDPKDTILWARFESSSDISDPTYGEDWELEGGVAPPLLLILGYGSGIQVWAIPANGEAVEVMSWRHGTVRSLRILPTPFTLDGDLADEPLDMYPHKRPLIALSDTSSANCGPHFCFVNIVSLKDGDQVKTIKFKHPVIDILANRTSLVVTFADRIAVFDSRTFEDRLTVTTCFPSPGINPNPVALGTRWMAYAERKLLPTRRSGGGCDCDGVSSYTATVLNAAKSLGKGLRELGEQMAAGLTGTTSHSASGFAQKCSVADSSSGNGDVAQPGIVTILDIKYSIKDSSPTSGAPISMSGSDPMVAHFIAHSDAIVALSFDNSGMLLFTADKRGHDFHVFRIQAHPNGTTLAAVHHLYILHRGDTSAKVQDVAFSLDSRWVAVSTLRGTTHVFPITSYGGPAGIRTHGSLHVVNRMSRFQRSAGLSVEGRSNSPVFHSEATTNQSCMAYNNPRLPPFPRPTVVLPLAQLRQPSALGTPPGSAQNSYSKASHGRQRVSSLSDDSKPLRVCAIFAKARSWLLDPPNINRETASHRMQRKAVDSLFIMAGHGALIQYDLDAKHASNIPKEKVHDETQIELEVEAKAQWNLLRKEGATEVQPPLANDNWLLKDRMLECDSDIDEPIDRSDDRDDRWLSQVEIVTHAGPHRRLWMGPQFVFKTYNTPSGSPLSHIDTEAVEIGVGPAGNRPARSNPVNMPISTTSRSAVPVLIESGSCSSFEQSPRLMDKFRHEHMDSDFALAHGDSQLKEDLADAMRESPAVQFREAGYTASPIPSTSSSSSSSATIGILNKKSSSQNTSSPTASTVLATDYHSSLDKTNTPSSSGRHHHQHQSQHHKAQSNPPRTAILIEKVVNPLGTVTTITHSPSPNDQDDGNMYMDFVDDYIIHENCDEALFRPVVAILAGDSDNEKTKLDSKYSQPPEPIGTELIVPVIEEKYVKKPVTGGKKSKQSVEETEQIAKFEEMSLINKRGKTQQKKAEKIEKLEKERTPPPKQVLSCENENFSPKKSERKKEPETTGSSKPIAETQKDSGAIRKTQKTEAKEVTITQSTQKASVATSKSATIRDPPQTVTRVLAPKEKESGTKMKLEEDNICDTKKISSTIMTSKSTTEPKRAPIDAGAKQIEQERQPTEKKDSRSKPVKEKTPKRETQMTESSANAEYPSLEATQKSKSSGKKKATVSVILSESSACGERDEKPAPTNVWAKNPLKNFADRKDEPKSSIEVKETNLEVKSKKQKSPSPMAKSPQDSPKATHKLNLAESPQKKSNVEVEECTYFSVNLKKKPKKSPEDETPKEVAASVIVKEPKKSSSRQKSSQDILDYSPDPVEADRSSFPKLSLDALPADFAESLTLSPLSPLDPFGSKVERLQLGDQSEEPESLINFESPLQEKSKSEELLEVKGSPSPKVSAGSKTPYTEDNIIFALCGSLHEAQSGDESLTPKKSTSRQKDAMDSSEYKSLELPELGEVDQYLSLDTKYLDTSSSSSEETEESSYNMQKKDRQKLAEEEDDDEELRPLIGGANSTCSMTSSSTSNKKDDVVSSGATAPGISARTIRDVAKLIDETLPDNNQSDSSVDRTKNNAAESRTPAEDADDDEDPQQQQQSNDSDPSSSSAGGSSASSTHKQSNGSGGGKPLSQATQEASDGTGTVLTTTGSGGNNTGGLQQNSSNGKKKSKKKKR